MKKIKITGFEIEEDTVRACEVLGLTPEYVAGKVIEKRMWRALQRHVSEHGFPQEVVDKAMRKEKARQERKEKARQREKEGTT